MATFQLALLDEAVKFLQELPQQTHKKILYNIGRVAGGESFSRNWRTPRYGSFALSTTALPTGSSPFGTRKSRRWW